MILSMTGFGLGTAPLGPLDGDELRVELRSVNHKFCEVKARLPSDLAPLELELVKRVKDRLKRGAIDLFVRRGNTSRPRAEVRVDLEAARGYVIALREAAGALGIEQNLGMAELAQIPGIVSFEERIVAPEEFAAALFAATDRALEALLDMRRREGESLAVDLLGRTTSLRSFAAEVARLSPASVDAYRERLEARIQELSRNVPVDPQRLAQEVAIFADRVDIAEELSRLASHLDQFESMVKSDEPMGRKLEFLVQELNREVNTTGSKSQAIEISRRVVAMKAEIERIREQVANVA